jgi:hypothetical protein
MKAYGFMHVYIHIFLTSALDGGEWSASRPRLNARAGLKELVKRKFLTLPGLELQLLCRPARGQSLYQLRYPGSPFNYRRSN